MENVSILIVAVLAGISTYYISIHMGKGAVFASAVVTLVSGIVFPHFIPSIGSKLAVVAACASYAGMVTVKKVPELWEMAIISLMAGIIFIASSTVYIGVGGKLGTIAAISCFAWIGFKQVYKVLTKKEKPVGVNIIDQH